MSLSFLLSYVIESPLRPIDSIIEIVDRLSSLPTILTRSDVDLPFGGSKYPMVDALYRMPCIHTPLLIA